MTTSIKNIFEQHLDQGKLVFWTDSRKPNVALPSHLMNRMDVRLNLSRSFNTKIFELTDTHIRIDLGFNGVRFLCEIPFSAVYFVAMADNPEVGVEFPENFPDEIKRFHKDPEAYAQAQRVVAAVWDIDIPFTSSIAHSDIASRKIATSRHEIDLATVVQKQTNRKVKAKTKQ